MSRVYNFSAGPAVLPEEVLKEVEPKVKESGNEEYGEDAKLVQSYENLINTYGKIIEVGETVEVVTGTVTEKDQSVTVEITAATMRIIIIGSFN